MELYLGEPVFAGGDEREQLGLIMECVGVKGSDGGWLKVILCVIKFRNVRIISSILMPI